MTIHGDRIPTLPELLERITDLHSLPPIVAHLNRVLGDPATTAQALADAISIDVAMAATVMRLVNSSYFGFSRKIGSLKTAIVILGFNEMRKLVLALGTVRAFGCGASALPLVAFWRHSAAVGFFAERIAERSVPRLRDEAFVVGLLHDVGKIIVALELPDAFARVAARVAAGEAWQTAERAELDFDHGEVGGGLASLWDFPESITAAIRWHHEEGAAESAGPLRDAVELADTCVRAALVDLPLGGPLAPVSPGVWDRLRLEPGGVGAHFERLDAGLSFVEELLGGENLLPRV